MKAYKHKKKVNCIRKKQDKKIVTLIRQMSNYFFVPPDFIVIKANFFSLQRCDLSSEI